MIICDYRLSFAIIDDFLWLFVIIDDFCNYYKDLWWFIDAKSVSFVKNGFLVVKSSIVNEGVS